MRANSFFPVKFADTPVTREHVPDGFQNRRFSGLSETIQICRAVPDSQRVSFTVDSVTRRQP